MKRQLEFKSEFFKQNREKFIAKMKPNSIAIFHSGDIFHKSADANFSFFQNPDTYYLSGIDQEETILVLYPDAPNPAWKENVYLKETSDHIKVWEGFKYTIAEAKELSGIKNCFWTKSSQQQIRTMMNYAENVYINLNEHDRAHYDGDYMDLRCFRDLKHDFPAHNYERSAPILYNIRMSKSVEEIATMQKAADITTATFIKLLKEFKRFKTEHEIEAFLTYEFMMNKATHAYNPIIASGLNSCILHYNDNNQDLKSGDILLMDFGCSYSNYASDLSRTIPVSGKFSDRQKLIYNATLDVFKEAKKLASNSITLLDWNNQGKKLMETKLIEIGLLHKSEVEKQDPNNPLYRKHFPHGLGHFLGLDVHDVGNQYSKMPENSVITNEPGIYIWDENLGVRIENDLLVSSKGVIDFMEKCPIEVEEIEDLMN
jgi:Xaa-Pro aminopeptidase